MLQPISESESAPPKAPAPVRAQPRFPAWVPVLVLALMTLLAYQPVWHAGFIWDDDAYVRENLNLRSAGGLARIWCQPTATPQYYPLVYTSFWLEYHLWGLNPLGYHLVNVLLHILAAGLFWRMLVRLQVPGAWLAAAIFALHPVNVESVAWVTERKNVLSAVFYFAAALAYWRWQQGAETSNLEPRTLNLERPESESGSGGSPTSDETLEIGNRKSEIGNSAGYFIALGLFIAALLSKTITCTFPAAMLLLIWWKRGRIERRDVWPTLPFFGAGMGMGLLTSWLERTHVKASGPDWAFSFGDRCLIAGRAVWFYAAKLFWPAKLTFVYPRWEINTGQWWQWLFPAALAAVIILLWCLRGSIGRGPLAAGLFFVGTLFPALGFVNVYPMRFSFVADHFQYLASAGLIALAVAAMGKMFKSLPLAAVLLPLGLGVITWNQAHIYADKETLWRDTLAKNPACWMAHCNLGIVLLEKGRVDEAIDHFHEAIRMKPDYDKTYYNLGAALDIERQTDDAISQYQEALSIDPDFGPTHNNLGADFLKQGRIGEAIKQFEEAIRLDPDNAQAHNNFGTALAEKGDLDGAAGQFQEAVRLQPDYARAHNNLGLALANKGRINEAISEFQEALRLQPGFAGARDNLARAMEFKNQSSGNPAGREGR